MHIVMILPNDYLEPKLDTRVYKEAQTLHKEGHEITIICRGFDASQPKKETHEGIEVARIHAHGALSYGKWVIGAIKRFNQITSPDAIHGHDIGGAAIGALITLNKNIPLIYDAHELATELHQPKWISVVVGLVEHIVLRRIAGLLVTNTQRLGVMKQKYSVLERFQNIGIVSNYPLKVSTKQSNKSKNLTFLYQGPMSFEKRGIDTVIKAFASFEHQAKLMLIGNAGEEVKELIEGCDAKNQIELINWVDQKTLRKLMAQADIGIVAYKNVCLNNYYCAPNKTYEYMQAKMAILGSKFPIFDEEITKEHLGFVADFSDVESVRSAMQQFIELDKKALRTMQESALRAYNEAYNWDVVSKHLLTVYEELDVRN